MPNVDLLPVQAMMPTHPFSALNDCHCEIQARLLDLRALASRLQEGGEVSDPIMAAARQAHLFFTTKALVHHVDEERRVFPFLLESGSESVKASVEALRHDHALLKQLWLQIAPLLDAVARGHRWRGMVALPRSLNAFVELYAGHMAAEDELMLGEQQAQPYTANPRSGHRGSMTDIEVPSSAWL
jgi:hypothetical protein